MTTSEFPSGTAETRLNVYIHIPFCIKKCSFCYIPVLSVRQVSLKSYVEALKSEASCRAPRYGAGDARVETLYLGGGTPSLLGPELLADLLGAIRGALPFSGEASLSMECHPGPHDTAYFRDLLAAGLNRLAICAQTFDEGRLAHLKRLHSGEEATACLQRAREAGFPHLGCELMWGYPDARPGDMARDFARAVSAGATEVTFQWFNVHPGGYLPDAREQDRLFAMFVLAKEEAERVGFRQVGAQSFAAPGSVHRHHALNGPGLGTTPYGKVLGLGWGAMSYLGGGIESHPGSLETYLADPGAGHLQQAATEEELAWGAFSYGLTVRRAISGAWLKGPDLAATKVRIRATSKAWHAAGLLQEAPTGDLTMTVRGEALLDAYLHAVGTSNRGGSNPLSTAGEDDARLLSHLG